MAYARVAATNFDTQYMADLVTFAWLFGAFRLRYYYMNTCRIVSHQWVIGRIRINTLTLETQT